MTMFGGMTAGAEEALGYWETIMSGGTVTQVDVAVVEPGSAGGPWGDVVDAVVLSDVVGGDGIEDAEVVG